MAHRRFKMDITFEGDLDLTFMGWGFLVSDWEAFATHALMQNKLYNTAVTISNVTVDDNPKPTNKESMNHAK
jgi:hypothetical protein